MMKITKFLFFLAILSLTACGDDDGATNNSNLLSYDGDNANAPALEVGTHILATYFPASDLQGRIGKKLTEVEVFVDQGAQSYRILVFGPDSATTPGDVLREVDFTSNVNARKWAIVDIDPLEITGEDLWIGVEVVHNLSIQTIGCDSGPRKNGGDWIWNSNDQVWTTFLSQTGTESINWNIRGHLVD